MILRRVWECLKERGPMTAVEMTAALGLGGCDAKHPSSQAGVALRTLVERRKAKIVTGAGKRHPQYQAIGKKPPEDMRGKTKGSREALEACRSANAIRFHARRGHKLRPVATTALEQAWGWLPRSSQALTVTEE